MKASCWDLSDAAFNFQVSFYSRQIVKQYGAAFAAVQVKSQRGAKRGAPS
jgi:hypothetical protein